MKKLNKKGQAKGFTLTELVIVIVIIAILAAVLIPSMTGYVNRAKKSNATQEAANTYTVFSAWLVDSTDTYGYEKTVDNMDSLKATYNSNLSGALKEATTIELVASKVSVNTDATSNVTTMTIAKDYKTDSNLSSNVALTVGTADTDEVKKSSGDNPTYTITTVGIVKYNQALTGAATREIILAKQFKEYLAKASDTTVANLKTTVTVVEVTKTNSKITSAKVVIKASNNYYVTINYSNGAVTYTDPTTAEQK